MRLGFFLIGAATSSISYSSKWPFITRYSKRYLSKERSSTTSVRSQLISLRGGADSNEIDDLDELVDHIISDEKSFDNFLESMDVEDEQQRRKSVCDDDSYDDNDWDIDGEDFDTDTDDSFESEYFEREMAREEDEDGDVLTKEDIMILEECSMEGLRKKKAQPQPQPQPQLYQRN